MKKRAIQILITLALALVMLTMTSSRDHGQIGSGTVSKRDPPSGGFRFFNPS